MEENKNEFMLWVGIMAFIGLFIYFMPSIDKLIYGRAKKDKDAGKQTVEKVEQEKQTSTKTKKEKELTSIPSQYECTLDTKESFYSQKEVTTYKFDTKGNTLKVDSEVIINVDSKESYDQMKATYQGIVSLYGSIGSGFKKYYSINNQYDDNSRIISVTSKLSDYSKAMEYIDKYNKEHENETISLSVYKNYSDAEINMKSNGYTCKASK